MKAWIEQRIKLMHEKNRNVIVFPVERRQNDIAEKRYKELSKKGSEEKTIAMMVRETLYGEKENDNDGPEVA